MHALWRYEVANDRFIVKRRIHGRAGPRRDDVREDAFRTSALVEVVVY